MIWKKCIFLFFFETVKFGLNKQLCVSKYTIMYLLIGRVYTPYSRLIYSLFGVILHPLYLMTAMNRLAIVSMLAMNNKDGTKASQG